MHNTVCKVEETSQQNQRAFILETARTCARLCNNIPHGGSSDASHDEDTAQAERVGHLEDEDVLEEERVQLCELWG